MMATRREECIYWHSPLRRPLQDQRRSRSAAAREPCERSKNLFSRQCTQMRRSKSVFVAFIVFECAATVFSETQLSTKSGWKTVKFSRLETMRAAEMQLDAENNCISRAKVAAVPAQDIFERKKRNARIIATHSTNSEQTSAENNNFVLLLISDWP